VAVTSTVLKGMDKTTKGGAGLDKRTTGDQQEFQVHLRPQSFDMGSLERRRECNHGRPRGGLHGEQKDWEPDED